MNWCNSTLRSTWLTVFTCPSDPNNGTGNPFFTTSDFRTTPSTPHGRLTGIPLTTGRGAITGRSRARPTWTTRSTPSATTASPYPREPKIGVMGLNYGVKLASITDGLSNTAMVAEMRAGLSSMDIRGIWAMGLGGQPLLPGPVVRSDPELHGRVPAQVQRRRRRDADLPASARSFPTAASSACPATAAVACTTSAARPAASTPAA